MTRLAILAILLLAACGLREPLRPPPGESLPVAPAEARDSPTADELLAQPVIARPARVDELLRRSEEREDDRFNLPPAEVPAGVPPVPESGPSSGQPSR